MEKLVPSSENHQLREEFEVEEPTIEVPSNLSGRVWLRIFAQYPGTFSRYAEDYYEGLRTIVRGAELDFKKPWREIFDESRLGLDFIGTYPRPEFNIRNGLSTLSPRVLEIVRPEIAYNLVCWGSHDYYLKNQYLVEDLYRRRGEFHLRPEVVTLLANSTQMWLALRRISECKGYTETERLRRLGLEKELFDLVENQPSLWAEALHLILANIDAIGDVAEVVTITLAQKSGEVLAALKSVTENSENIQLRELARGLVVVLQGNEHPKPETIHHLLDHLARWAGVGFLFPHPLSPPSSTWLSSNETEKQLRSRLCQGLSEFKKDFRLQGAKNERALVEKLLTELSVPFRDSKSAVLAIAQKALRFEPKITLEHRTLKEAEETVHGPDIAFIVQANMQNAMTLKIAEFVQVKKPNRTGEKWIDSWVINVAQLNDLLKTSASAVYWLIDTDGTVLAVPAKLVKARIPGKKSNTFTLRFNEVRSTAIPIDQFLVELLIGAWIGSGESSAIEIALGNDPKLVPRNLVEIQVRATNE